ncbi:MAG TPA: Calx-beta domain-containing protein [Pseudoxanthomonas sp.]|nr:Calx-beta domain-containing protein [Pseudoxanthomonas sp.]
MTTPSLPHPSIGTRIKSAGRTLSLAVLTIILCQCGGGGGKSAASPSTPTPPTPPTPTQPTVSISNGSATEGTTMVFTVSLSASSSTSVTVKLSTSNGTAVAPADYTAQTGVTVTVPAGSTSATVNVPTVNDTTYEGNKTFAATISSPTNATLGTASGTGTIIDDEDPPTPPPPPPPPPPVPAGQDALVIDVSYVNRSSTAYSRFRDWVDSGLTANPYGYSAYDPAFMYLLVNDAKYCNRAVALANQQVTEAEAAISAGGRPAISGDSYLEVGPMIADVAMTLHACPSFVDQAKRTRWSAYAEQAIWNVWHHNEATWGGRSFPWSGWSTDNPGNNYYYSFLEATMYWGLVVNSSTWLNDLRQNRLPPLRTYFAALPGGGSREGTGYGTAHMRLFAVYRVWRDSTGEDLANASPHATDSIFYWIHATVPTLDRFAPIGDQSRDREANLYDYQRRLMLEARKLTTNAQAYSASSWWLNNISVKEMSSSFNRRFDLLPAGSGGSAPTALIYHATGVGHFFARTGWDRAAMWMSIVAGPYNESHAHQDQGSFQLFSGNWLAVTANTQAPSNGINQGTDVHNLVRFVRNGTVARQCESTTRASTLSVTPGSGGGAFTATANLTPAFCDNTAVTSWTRQFTFGSRKLTVRDQFAITSGTTATFQVNTPVQPVLVNSREATAGRLRVRVLEPTNATIDSNFSSGKYVESGGGYRIDVTGGTTGYLVELSEVQ